MGGASSDYFTFISVEKHRPVEVLDILDGVYSRRKSHSIWMMERTMWALINASPPRIVRQIPNFNALQRLRVSRSSRQSEITRIMCFARSKCCKLNNHCGSWGSKGILRPEPIEGFIIVITYSTGKVPRSMYPYSLRCFSAFVLNLTW
jgi:hypothetical protein